MSERNSSSFDYEFTGSAKSAAEFHDGDQINTYNRFRTEGLASYEEGREIARAALGYERPPTPDELKAMHVGAWTERVYDGLRTRRVASDLARQGYTQDNIDLAAGEQ